MSMALKDRITALVIFVLSVAGYFTANNYTYGAGTFPKGILIISIILSVLLFISSVTGLSKQDEGEEIDFFRLISVIVLSAAYFFTIVPVGYFIVTPLYLFAVTFLLGYRKIKTLVLYPLFFSLFLFIVFRTFLNVPLPMGLLG